MACEAMYGWLDCWDYIVGDTNSQRKKPDIKQKEKQNDR